MLSFFWKSRYSVGVREMDKQHQVIMQHLNELHEELLGGKINQTVIRLSDDLVSLAIEHFTAEEKLMESTQFPGLAEHRASHQWLLAKVRDFTARQESGDPSAYCQFMYFVREWMTRHMEKEDQRYAPWLAEHGIS